MDDLICRDCGGALKYFDGTEDEARYECQSCEFVQHLVKG